MSITRFVSRVGLGSLVVAAAAIAGTTAIQPAQAGVLERLQMLDAAGSGSEQGVPGGLSSVDFDLAVIDTMIEELMAMSETARVGMMSEDPAIAEMSAQMMEVIEAELEQLNAMRSSKLSERLDMLRSTSPESGIN